MDYRDNKGYLVDLTYDGGDSAHFAGLSGIFGNKEPLADYEISPGLLTRHPISFPYNNPKNFTVDQLTPLVAALRLNGRTDITKRVFWSHAKRFFFAQNFERDVPGSTKYPWPNSYHLDSDPNKEIVFKYFDFADPLGPADIWHLILCAQIRWLYFFGLIGYPCLFISVCLNGISSSNDQGQIISKAVIGGKFFLKLYKKTKPNWRLSLCKFWSHDRSMVEMYRLISSKLDEV